MAADRTNDSRIVFVSSEGYKISPKINYSQLQTPPPGDKDGYLDMIPIFQRYCTSKLAILYMTMELNRRLLARGHDHIFVNAIHPGLFFIRFLAIIQNRLTTIGRTPETGIAEIENRLMGPQALRWMKAILSCGYMLTHSVEDAAKTQIFMSASKVVREGNIHGEYWVISSAWWPTVGHWPTYQGSIKENLTVLGADREEWRKLWDFCVRAVRKVANSPFSSLALDTDTSM